MTGVAATLSAWRRPVIAFACALGASSVLAMDTDSAPPAADQHLSFLLRNYAESQQFDTGARKDAWVQGMQANYASTYARGDYALGGDVSLYGALKLNGGRGAGNMVHAGSRTDSANETAWAYVGAYALKARAPGVDVTYGLQGFVTPFIEPFDNRALPPTFRGLNVLVRPSDRLSLGLGDFDGVKGRGYTDVRPLSSAYGGVRFAHLRHLGADWNDGWETTMSLYGARAQDVWNQYYVAASHSIRPAGGGTWTGKTQLYYTRDQGDRLQGAIDNKTYSLALHTRQPWGEAQLSYQRVLSEQFFDFVSDTTGTLMPNTGLADYNAPHERSVMLRGKINEQMTGVAGLQAGWWFITGWDADASVQALSIGKTGGLHQLYWNGSAPVGGRHHEFAFKPSYTWQDGELKNMCLTLTYIYHEIADNYPAKGSAHAFKLRLEVPIAVF